MAKILCIEDEPALLEDLAEELRDTGYEVFEAKDGEAGIESIQSEHPDLVLCDMTMPKMGGKDILAAVRKLQNDVANTPFIFLTAKATKEDIIEGQRLGADGYLTKPVDYELLLATVQTRLEQATQMKKHPESVFPRLRTELFRDSPGSSDRPPAGDMSPITAET